MQKIANDVQEIFIEESLDLVDRLHKANCCEKIEKLLKVYKKSCDLMGFKDLSVSTQEPVVLASNGGSITPELVSSVNNYLSIVWQTLIDIGQHPSIELDTTPPQISILQNNLLSKSWWQFWR